MFARIETIRVRARGSRAVCTRSTVSDISERRQAEEALVCSREDHERRVIEGTAEVRESERRARAVVDSLTAHMAIVDEDGCILSVNQRWRNFAKRNGATLISVCEGANYLAECDAAASRSCGEAGAVAIGVRSVLSGDLREFASDYACHSATQKRWFTVRVTPVPGVSRRLAVIFHETITVRIRAESAVREREEQSRFALETCHIGAWDLNLSDHAAHRSMEHDRIFGYSEMLPQWTYEMFLEHVLPEDRATVDGKYREARAAQSGWNFDCRIRRADGEVRWIWAIGCHYSDGTGGDCRLVGIVQDITERKATEAVLRDREERLRAILNTVADAIITIDPRGTITGVNPATTRIFGYAETEIVGRNVNILMPSPFREEHDGYLARFQRTGETRIIGIGREVVGLRKDGGIFPIDLAVTRVDHMGIFTGVIRDITERKWIEEEVLRIAGAERQRLAADLHDGICQELAGVSWLANVLRRDLHEARHPFTAKVRVIEKAIVRAIEQTRRVARTMNLVVGGGSGLVHALEMLAETTVRTYRIRCRF